MNQLKRISTRRAVLPHSLAELTPTGVESSLLREQIIGALRRAIELGTLKAGDRLVEKDLCTKFNISRTSLREALRDLEANGVVTKLSARTLVITPISHDDVRNISRVRAAIEMMLAEEFIECASDDDIAALNAALKRLRTIDPSSAASLDANRDYYETWCKGACNPFAFTVLTNIQLRLSVVRSKGLRHPELRLKSMEYQEAVIKAMARRNVKEAREIVHRHNQDVINTLIEVTKDTQDATVRQRVKAVK